MIRRVLTVLALTAALGRERGLGSRSSGDVLPGRQ